ncbi:TTLL5 polyglutamylase, partial [Amia calva]|nr:TTLL5 polyglutamylase [Amia calva]
MAALDSSHIHVQHTPPTSVPLSAQLASAASAPPQSSCPPLAPATLPRTSSLLTRPSSASVSAQSGHTAQPLQRSRSSSYSNQGSVSSVPRAVHIYSQRLSRPPSARFGSGRSNASRTQPGSATVSKDPDTLPDQEAIATALQRLADKQATRQYSASSHIRLLTQHLSNLNLASGALSRGHFALSPAVRQGGLSSGPVRAIHSDSALTNGVRALKDDDSTWEGETENAYSMITGVSPQQRYQPTTGSYQLQFAIQQLQQQKLQSRQLLDHSRARHQAILNAQPPSPAAPSSLSASSSSQWPRGPASLPWTGRPPKSTTSQGPPILAPKPPSSNREGITRKTATQRLNKLAPSEGHTNGTLPNTHHVVYEQISGNSSLSGYHRLLQGKSK